MVVGKLANSVLNKSESDIPLPFNGSYVLSPASDKSKFLLKFFLRFLIMIIQVSLYLFLSSAIELKLHNIPVTLKLVRKVIANFDYSEVSGFLCIPVVVLKHCEPELSYVLAEYFNLCLNES